jgi:hypothetical protein
LLFFELSESLGTRAAPANKPHRKRLHGLLSSEEWVAEQP